MHFKHSSLFLKTVFIIKSSIPCFCRLVKESENALEDTEVTNSTDINILPTTATELDKKKPVLNDSVNPTAQQNTNNNQSSKQSDVPPPVTTNVVKHGEAGANKKLTDFFQVRRSVRKTKKEVQWERDRDIEKAIREQRESGLKVGINSLPA